MPFQYEWKTDSTAQFRGSLAQNVGANLDLTVPGALAGIQGNCRGGLCSLTIISVENLAWELWLWESTTHGTVVLGTTSVIGRWTFVAGDGIQIAGAGDYYYYVDGLNVPVVDSDNSGKLHLTLVNRSVASKSAGDSGAIQVRGRIVPNGYSV